MKKINIFWFGFALTLSILAVVWCFEYADGVRGYNSTGGEVFTIALPLYVVWKKISDMGRKIQRLKRYNQSLKSML